MNLRLNLSGTAQMKRIRIVAHVVVAQQQAPQRLGEVGAEFVLLELPDDRLRAVVDEHLTQRLRAVQQPLAQQSELLLENLERFRVFELLDLGLRRSRARG